MNHNLLFSCSGVSNSVTPWTEAKELEAGCWNPEFLFTMLGGALSQQTEDKGFHTDL